MTSPVQYAARGPVAVLTMDNPPVNGLGLALRVGIIEAIDRALADPAVTAIVLTGDITASSSVTVPSRRWTTSSSRRSFKKDSRRVPKW